MFGALAVDLANNNNNNNNIAVDLANNNNNNNRPMSAVHLFSPGFIRAEQKILIRVKLNIKVKLTVPAI